MGVKKKTPMEQLTAGYEKLIQGKQINQDGKKAFNSTLKKAAKPKQRGSK